MRSRHWLVLALAIGLVALEAGPVSAQGLMLSQLAQGFGQNKVRYDRFDWWVLETDHFKVFYTPQYESLAQTGASMLERAYTQLSNDFHHRLSEKPPVILYESPYTFQQNNVILSVLPAGVGGFAEALRYRVVVPFNGNLVDLQRVLTHELAHIFTYDILYGGPIKGLLTNLNPPPDWIMEGLSAHAEGRMTTREAMVLGDAVLYDQLIPLPYMANFDALPRVYLAYRQAQSLMEYIEMKYGKDAVRGIARGWRINADIRRTVRDELGLTLEALEEDWTNYVRREYWSALGERSYVQEIAQRVLVQRGDELAYYLNPVWSPGGQMLAVHTVEKAALPAVNVYSIREAPQDSVSAGRQPEVHKEWEITRGLWEDEYDELNFEEGLLSWAGNGERIAFVARKGKVDRIFLWRVCDRRIEKVVTPEGIRRILGISLSPDGESIAFSGTALGHADIYVLNIATGRVEQITDTPGEDRAPAWSPDGGTLAFASQYGSGFDLVLYDLATRRFERIVWDGSDEHQPAWWPDGEAIALISDRDGVNNLYRYDLGTSQVQQLTRSINGLATPAVSPDGKQIALVAYRDGNYEVYMKAFEPGAADTAVVLKRVVPDSLPASPAAADSLPGVPFRKQQYRTALDIDYLAGTLTYTNDFLGVIMQLSTSDLLGDHRIDVTSDFWAAADNMTNLNFILSYYNFAHRLTWGVGIFTWSQYFRVWYGGDEQEGILKESQDGFWLEAAYPLDVYRRLELSYTSTDEREEIVEAETQPPGQGIRFLNLGYVLDTTVYGEVGPRAGGKYYLAAGRSVRSSEFDRDFAHVQTDLRRYFPLGRYSAFKLRVRGLASLGDDPIQHYLGGPPPVLDFWYTPIEGPLRGYEYGQFTGTRMVLANLEFNTVLVKRFLLGWPENFSMGRFDGTFFLDVGRIWEEGETAAKDIKGGIGFGLRAYPFGLPFNVEFARRIEHGLSKDWKVHFSIRSGF